MSENEALRLLREAAKAMRAFQSPRELMAEIEAFLDRSAPAWTASPPIEPGWYWARDEDDDSEPRCVEVFTHRERGPGYLARDEFVPVFERDLWSGPIEPPPKPKDPSR